MKSTANTDISNILLNSQSIFDKRNSLRNEVTQSLDQSILKETFDKESNGNSLNVGLMNEAKSRLFRDKESGIIKAEEAGEDFLILEKQKLSYNVLAALNDANVNFLINKKNAKKYEVKENVNV